MAPQRRKTKEVSKDGSKCQGKAPEQRSSRKPTKAVAVGPSRGFPYALGACVVVCLGGVHCLRRRSGSAFDGDGGPRAGRSGQSSLLPWVAPRSLAPREPPRPRCGRLAGTPACRDTGGRLAGCSRGRDTGVTSGGGSSGAGAGAGARLGVRPGAAPGRPGVASGGGSGARSGARGPPRLARGRARAWPSATHRRRPGRARARALSDP